MLSDFVDSAELSSKKRSPSFLEITEFGNEEKMEEHLRHDCMVLVVTTTLRKVLATFPCDGTDRASSYHCHGVDSCIHWTFRPTAFGVWHS